MNQQNCQKGNYLKFNHLFLPGNKRFDKSRPNLDCSKNMLNGFSFRAHAKIKSVQLFWTHKLCA